MDTRKRIENILGWLKFQTWQCSGLRDLCAQKSFLVVFSRLYVVSGIEDSLDTSKPSPLNSHTEALTQEITFQLD